ncbi:MAG: hypothetical protein CMM53_06405 [Rhodospirillaceae bacterium]|nr:hypothetical protein [Rhodospirillaceae bacterium]|tara:strand:+ start:134 stop:616 length:483 start_codon:yes stop_codon:yes gene_type:complete
MIIDKIPEFDDNQLLNLYRNAIRYLDHAEKRKEAGEILEAISSEWKLRLEQFDKGNYKATTPKIGLLKKMGYVVGQEGVKTVTRHKILDYIMENDLPPVSSPSYMEEWGSPMSRYRYKKLHRVLNAFVTGNQNKENIEKAIIEWKEDIDYIENNWRLKVF